MINRKPLILHHPVPALDILEFGVKRTSMNVKLKNFVKTVVNVTILMVVIVANVQLVIMEPCVIIKFIVSFNTK